MIFQSLARANEIGANSYSLTTSDARMVLDAGMHPKNEALEAIPHYELLKDQGVDTVVVTHSHLDHVGTLPVLMKKFPTANAFMTKGCAALTDAMLHNSVNVMTSKRSELGITDYPLFEHDDVNQVVERFRGMDYDRKVRVGYFEETHLTFQDAGHVLGSAGTLIENQGKRFFYTGDVQTHDQSLIKGADFDFEGGVDALVIESTRGATPTDTTKTRASEETRLVEHITQTINRNGSVLIPVFAMGKTQEMITLIHKNQLEGKIPHVPIIIGGLSTKMTIIYDKQRKNSRRSNHRLELMRIKNLQTASRRGGGVIRSTPRCIYLLSSGMMTEKTLSNSFARGFISNPKNSVLFVGYTDHETPGYALKQAERGTKIKLDPAEPATLYDCDLDSFDFSGHANREALLDIVKESQAKQVYLVHGDIPASEWMAAEAKKILPNSEIIIPEPGKKYEI